MRRNSRGDIFRESVPKTVALPRVGPMIFMSTLIVVVLPAPLAPISAYALPWGTVKRSPRRASKRPNFFHKPSTSIIGGHLHPFQPCPLHPHGLQQVFLFQSDAQRFHHQLLHFLIQYAR